MRTPHPTLLRRRLAIAAALVVACGGGESAAGEGAGDEGAGEEAKPLDEAVEVSKAALPDAKADPSEPKTDERPRDDTKQPERPADRAPGAKKPIVLSEIDVNEKSGAFGTGGLEIKAKGKLGEKIDSATYVQAKAVCKDGTRFLVDTGFVNADYRKPLQDHEVGETAELTGRFFMQGVEKISTPCQVEFRLAGAGGGISIPLERACYRDQQTTAGPCTPPVAAPAMSTPGGKPMRVLDLDVKTSGSFGTRGGLNANYVLEVKEAQENGTRITLKAACKVEDVKFVDIGITNLMAGPFKFESGEAVARSASLFFNPAFGFAEPPKLCDLQVATWKQKKGSFGSMERVLLTHSCYRDGRVTTGPCETGTPAPPAPAPVDAGSLVIDNVIMEVVEPYGAKGDRFQLKVQADALIDKPVDQFSSINTKVTCKVGKTARVETAYLYGVELHYLDPDETTRMSGTTFTSSPMDKRPQTCEAEFAAGRRFSPSGGGDVPLGKWCLRKGTMRKGKC